VLAERRPASVQLDGVAPGMDRLGIMLPYTPAHYLLFGAALDQPQGSTWLRQDCPVALVMTSANPSGEPLVRDIEEALERLGDIADVFVLHDRPIAVRCDDSVVIASGSNAGDRSARGRGAGPQPVFVRRARGYTPAPIRLSREGPCVLALGAHYKSTICLTRGAQAFVSQHLGDTDNAATRRLVDEAMAHWQTILALCPDAVACDMHPDYASSALAARVATELSIPLIAVQHHHAHIAAILAEHGHEGPVLGVALDGTGLGSDGTPWGGELLRVDSAGSERVSHLCPLPLAGGEAAAREPWRMGAAVLHRLGLGAQIAGRYAAFPAARHLGAVLECGLNAPLSSSMGRWFDAAAAVLGSCLINSYEGQAAMQLEALARGHASLTRSAAPGGRIDARGCLDLLGLVAGLLDEADAARGAARFHAGLIESLDDWIGRHAARRGLDTVALGGGCFLNAILSDTLAHRLQARGLRVLRAHQAPVNDGGLSLGQAWVAQRMLPMLERRAFAELAGAGRT
jgi:hydrogenase maturation protein HypF